MESIFKKLFIFSFILIVTGCGKNTTEIKYYISDEMLEQVAYGIDRLEEELASDNITMKRSSEKKQADLLFSIKKEKEEEPDDGFTINKSGDKISLTSESPRGLIYALLDLEEQLAKGISWQAIDEKSITADLAFRSIKFNLPWYSYRDGENLSLHQETVRDLTFWKAFLDMMVENKFNTLTLWNMHPYMYMVKSQQFPDASPFTDAEMQKWKEFWKGLFEMANQRGINTYIVNWNIFVSEAFAEKYNVAKYSSEDGNGHFGHGETNEQLEAYTKEVVTRTINEYPNLTGIGITLGERMGGMTPEERKNWVDRTILAGLEDADREARLIYRAPLSAGTEGGSTVSTSVEQMTRKHLENLGLKNDIWIPFKFNWSHGHSSPHLEIVHGGILTDTYWDPIPKDYRVVWTVRNEDFFVNRWADPDFIRTFLQLNNKQYVDGVNIGSETYTPAKDYFTKKKYQKWGYAFQRQWLFYKVWGNLLYNSATPDSYFADALADKFGLEDGTKLLEAWKLASKNPNRLASFYGSTWDRTLYSESFTDHTQDDGAFIDINSFINHHVLDSNYVNIPDFVAGDYNKQTQVTPLQLAEEAENDSKKIMELLSEIRKGKVTEALAIELNDIEFWANYGRYLALKLRAGIALHQYRQGNNEAGKKEAVNYLKSALSYWKKMVKLVEKYNIQPLPYQFDDEFSWRKYIPDVKRDIEIASSS